jgi:hypothetical protein
VKPTYFFNVFLLGLLLASNAIGLEIADDWRYTRDAEGEINGLMTRDREVIKLPAEELAKLHQVLFQEPPVPSRVASHKEAFQILDEKVRDPFIGRGPDDVYYLTGTTAGSHWGDTVGIRPSGKHELGYEGVLLKKIGDKYLLIASGRYAYELTDTYDLYYCVAESLEGPYGPRRMAIKNAGHGNLFQDHHGRWWSTAFDHEFIESENRWTPWLVPINVIDTGDDLRIEVLDKRFRPTPEDQKRIAELNRTGVPTGREGKKPWDK